MRKNYSGLLTEMHDEMEDMEYFEDATVGELETMLQLLPLIPSGELREFEGWVDGKVGFLPSWLNTDSGTTWYINWLKDKIKTDKEMQGKIP